MLGPKAPSPVRNLTPCDSKTLRTESATFTLTASDPASNRLREARLIPASSATSSGLNPKPTRAALRNRPEGNIPLKKHRKCSKATLSTICLLGHKFI